MENSSQAFEQLTTYWQAALARITHGISPAGVNCAFYSWAAHLVQAPGKVLEISTLPATNLSRFAHRMVCERDDQFCVREPGHKNRFYHYRETPQDHHYIDPDEWLVQARYKEGSWWEKWDNWLQEQSIAEKVAPPPVERSLGAAPGTYVLQK